MIKKKKKISAEKKNFLFKKDVQVTEEACSSQNIRFLKKILLLWVIFALLDRIPNTDPDPNPLT
jgi:hypothetical protein